MNRIEPVSDMRMQCGIFRMVDDRLSPVLAVTDDDHIVLLVDVTLPTALATNDHELIVDLYRGDELRHRHQQHIGRGNARRCSLAFRIHWGSRSDASSRLLVSVFVDDRQMARFPCVVGCPEADAQGRIAPSGRAVSEQTLLVVQNALDNELFE